MPFQPHYVSIAGAAGITGGTAVVIDVLRAFTTAAWAFALGAERIFLTDDVDEALALKTLVPGALAMKDSRPLPGFELSNSPVELQAHDLADRSVVQRTTHGTVGALAAKRAKHIYCASFVNAAATAEAILRTGDSEAYFVVTGEDGLAEEDLACAEYVAALLEQAARSPGPPDGRLSPSPQVGRGLGGGVDPAPYLARVAASNQARIHAERVANGTPGMHALDVDCAMEINRLDFAMMAREEHVEGFGPALVLRAYNQSE